MISFLHNRDFIYFFKKGLIDIKRCSRIVSVFITVLILLSSVLTSVYATVPETASEAAVLIDAKSKSVLYEKNSNEKLAPASTTKIMTLLLAAEYGKLDEKVTVNTSLLKDLPSDATIAYFQQGEITTVKDLFMAVYLISANDAAIILANHIGQSVDGFVNMMNEKAKKLGCDSTNFVNPTGLNDENQLTTVSDMAKMAEALYENQTARPLFSTLSYTISASPTRAQSFEMLLKNDLMTKTSESYYPSVTFGKTGYTDASKYTIAAIAQKDDTTLVSVSFCAASKQDMYGDVQKMLDYGFGDFYKLTISKAELEALFSGKRNEEIKVKDDIKLLIPSSVKRENLIKSVETSDGVAFVSVKGDGYNYSQKIADVVTKKGPSGFFGAILWFIKLIFKIIFYIIIIFVLLYLLLTIYVNIKKKNKKKKNNVRVKR